jgi:hypothetical protein
LRGVPLTAVADTIARIADVPERRAAIVDVLAEQTRAAELWKTEIQRVSTARTIEARSALARRGVRRLNLHGVPDYLPGKSVTVVRKSRAKSTGTNIENTQVLAYYALWHLVSALGFMVFYLLNHVRFTEGQWVPPA